MQAEDPSFQPNLNFGRDAFNVVVGFIWRMGLLVIPIYIIIRETGALIIALAVLLLTTWLLKRFWYDRLVD